MTTNVTHTLKINGMACHNCAGKVEKGLSALAGVAGVSVDLAGKTATVIYDPVKTDIQRIKVTVESLGFEVL